MGRQCLWTLVITDRQFQVLPRTSVVAKSQVIGDHCRTVSSLVQDLMSDVRLLLAAAGRAWYNSFRVTALSKIAYFPK